MGTSAAAATVAASQWIGGCTGSQNRDELNLYSSRHYHTDDQLYADFTQQTGIQVNLVEGKADELIERIKSEGANSPADILLTVDVARLWRAEQAGIFAPVNSPLLEERIPPSLRHSKGYWFGFSKRARAIVYNREQVEPSELSTYEELANPQWKGKLAVRSSENTYNQSLVASLILAHGEAGAEAWCRALVANFARPPQGNDTAQIEAAASGVADLALANTYYLARYATEKDPAKQEVFKQVGVFFPNQEDRGTHVNISGAGAVRTAPNREGAIQFLEYLSGEKAQEFFARGNYEYPAVPGVPLDPTVASFGTFKADEANLEAIGPYLPTAVKIMARAGWR